MRTLTLIAGLTLTGSLAAQTNNDPKPAPAQGPPPGLNAAMPQASIPSFPMTPAPNVAPVQPYQPSRPQLSPYLNLFRGNTGGGIGAVDYYNFVRPGLQSSGSYVGRSPGSPVRPGGGVPLDPDVQLDPGTVLRPAGTPTVFMNTAGYFNSMGTIGAAARPGSQQQQRPGGYGRR